MYKEMNLYKHFYIYISIEMEMIQMENKISGKNIVELRTLNSQYAGNMIQAIDDHEQFYVINVAELLKLINNDNVIFNKNKKITRTHLTIKESESK